MRRRKTHFISPYKIWRVQVTCEKQCLERFHTDHNRYVWADNATLAEEYYQRHASFICDHPLTVTFVHPVPDAEYDLTLNCEINDPLRYQKYHNWFECP